MKVMQSRFEINEFMDCWKSMEQNQMYCFFKFWTLGMRHELHDCEAVLDLFARYDAVFGKYKKVMTEGLKSVTSKSGKSGRSYVNGLKDRFKNGIESGLKYGGNGREQKVEEREETVDVVHDTDDDEKAEMEKGTVTRDGNGMPSENGNIGKDEKQEMVKHGLSAREKMKDIRILLNTVCKVILKEQVPLLWGNRADTFNEQLSQFVLKYTQKGLMDQKVL